jgi:Polyketide cyclase / dehydrase and lipid transport
MPTIDLSADIEIASSPADIAAVMFDPAREPEWMAAVKTVEIVDAALQAGARVRRTGTVMGKDIAWTSQVEAVHFPHVLSLRIAGGPFVGLLSYNIQRSGGGSRVRIQTRGDVPSLDFIPAAMIELPLQSALDADLARLKAIVETAR